MPKVLVAAGAAVMALTLACVGTLALLVMMVSAAPDASACSGPPPATSPVSIPDAEHPAASGSPVPSSVDIDSAVLAAINGMDTDANGENDYRQVANERAADGQLRYDIGWTLLAGIDHRENGNDPTRSALSGEDIGEPNDDNPSVVTTSKIDSIQRSALHLKDMARGVYGLDITAASTGEDIKLALLAYNRGNAYKVAGRGPDESPYVMNRFDVAHESMMFPTDIPGETAGGIVDANYGGYTLFVRLGGATGFPCRAGLSGDARELLDNPNVILTRDSQRADLEEGLIDPRIIGVLAWMARDHVITITSLRTDHSPCAGGASNERSDGSCVAGLSNHGFGRAADVSVLDGEHVSPSSGIARGVVDAILAADGQLGLTELGQPFYDRSVGQVYVFTAAHSDHIHVGIDADAAIVSGAPGTGGPSDRGSGVPAVVDGMPEGWTEVDDCNGTDGHWGTTNAINRTIYYCSTVINASGGEASKWNYVRQHERCHARAFEGIETFTWTDERATDRCAAANGADTSWSPY